MRNQFAACEQLRLSIFAAAATLSCLFAASASASTPLDCPLRDAPFSLDSPLIDVLLSPDAKTALGEVFPLDRLPPQMLSTETPSFGAIVTVRNFAGFAGVPEEALAPLEQELANIEVTDSDRVARCARYDNDIPDIDLPGDGVKLLVFHKINGFDHGESVTAATKAIRALADEQGWAVAVTNRGGAFMPELLEQFDAVVWNNVSGDVLTLSQRKAFRDYIENGGGYVGLHGSGGDPVWFWDWYKTELLGAQFIGHPANPQFQEAAIQVESNVAGIGESLAAGWFLNEEWYSFEHSPRGEGTIVIATIDESTYEPVGYSGESLAMGDDHPIVWARCVGAGRSFYSAVGHRLEVYQDKRYMELLRDGLAWAVASDKPCTLEHQAESSSPAR